MEHDSFKMGCRLLEGNGRWEIYGHVAFAAIAAPSNTLISGALVQSRLHSETLGSKKSMGPEDT